MFSCCIEKVCSVLEEGPRLIVRVGAGGRGGGARTVGGVALLTRARRMGYRRPPTTLLNSLLVHRCLMACFGCGLAVCLAERFRQAGRQAGCQAREGLPVVGSRIALSDLSVAGTLSLLLLFVSIFEPGGGGAGEGGGCAAAVFGRWNKGVAAAL